MSDISIIPRHIRTLYDIVHQLESEFPGRKFTPDGHLVGSIGEVISAYLYDLELLANSSSVHDAVTRKGQKVQIKATQGNSVSLRSKPDHLIVLRLNNSGECKEIYNGPGGSVWNNCGKMQANGQRSITLFRLRKLMEDVKSDNKIRQIRDWPNSSGAQTTT